MDRDQLAAAHTAVIRRHWRTLNDHGGQPSGQLLDDLAAVAGRHADDMLIEAHGFKAVAKPEDGGGGGGGGADGDGKPLVVTPGTTRSRAVPAAGATPRPRRTSTRRTAK